MTAATRLRRQPPQPTVWAIAAALAALQLAGCAGPGAGAGAQSGSQPAGAATGAASAARPAPEAAKPQPEAPPPAPLTPAQVKGALTAASELLEAGQEDAAQAELDKILRADPRHREALLLNRQIHEDPVAMLGRESFSYRVQPGESLSLIAQRALGDRYLFYALARYNAIRVPRQLAAGQTIKVPGRAMPAAPAPAPKAAMPAPPAAPPAAPAVRTPPAAAAPMMTAPAPAPDPARAERDKAAAINRHVREARTAFQKQDLEGAIAAWNKVLEIDPTHRVATAERQRAIDLNERAKKLPAAR